jgi:O-antigen ligase/polysaccharide polymerase Wzy-like membrane protein
MRLENQGIPEGLDDAVVPAFVGLLAYSAFAQGGYYIRQAVVVAAGLLVLAVLVRRLERPVAPGVAGFAMLGGALLASGIAAGWPWDVWRPIATLVAAGATLVLTRAILRSGEGDRLLGAIAWFATGIAVLGLVGVALHWFPWAMKAQGLWRMSSTLTYSNAAAALLTLALPAPLVLALRRPGALHRLQAFAISAALITTLSRGGAVGAVAMIAVLAACGGGQILAQLIRPGLGALAASVAMVPTIASTTPRPALAFAGLCAGGALAAVPLRLSIPARRTVAVALAVAVAALAMPALAASENAGQFVASRISRSSDDRTMFWRASLDTALQHPVLGTGPGTYRGLVRDKDRFLLVFYVHNEYLQAMAETGLVGLASILIAIAVFAGWAWRRRPGRSSPERAVWAAAVAAGTAFCVHGFFDFMWRVPAVVLLAFVWLAFAVDSKERNPA